MTKNFWIIIAVLAIVVVGGGFFLINSKQTQAPTTTPTPVLPSPTSVKEEEFLFSEQNNSGVSGSGRLVEDNGKVIFTLNLIGGSKTTPHPAHVHEGTCEKLGEVKFPLTDVVDGKSETIVDTTADELVKSRPLAVNIHKSKAQINTYVACVDLNL